METQRETFLVLWVTTQMATVARAESEQTLESGASSASPTQVHKSRIWAIFLCPPKCLSRPIRWKLQQLEMEPVPTCDARAADSSFTSHTIALVL